MEFENIGVVIDQIDPNATFNIINQARPAGDYVFGRLLPEQNRVGFDVKGGSIRIVPTMAGLVGKDSPYPPGGFTDTKTFLEKTAKLALTVPITEESLIEMHTILTHLRATGAPTTDYIVNVALNFANKVLAQAQLDTMEWLRGKALVDHAIDWQFNGESLEVDYQIDAQYRPAAYTGANGFGGSTSKFWTAIRLAQALLKYDVEGYYAHPDTIAMIVDNGANAVEVLNQDNGSFEVVQLKAGVGGGEKRNEDIRYRVRLNAYGAEGEIIDPANPRATIKVPFMARGKVLVVGRGSRRGFQIGDAAPGQGATPDDGALTLGYTHIAPTVEGRFRPGRWGRVFTPQDRPWAIQGDTVARGLPVIQSDSSLVTLTTDMT